ncbi:hypothetical protein ACVWY3_005019 [Bradyrhizobium sp. USDA 4486]
MMSWASMPTPRLQRLSARLPRLTTHFRPGRVPASGGMTFSSSREEGKTFAEGIGEVARAGQIFQFFAGECLRMTGESLPSVRPLVGVEITREPLGVIGLIAPWNFPIAIPAWKIAPALALRQHRCVQACRARPGFASCARQDHRPRRSAGRCIQPSDGPRLGGWRGDAKQLESFCHFLYRLSADRAQDRPDVHTTEAMKKLQLEMGAKKPWSSLMMPI